MRRSINLIAVTGFFLFNSCVQPVARSGDKEFNTPVEYNDFIIDQQNAIIKRMIKLPATFDSGTDAEIRIQFDSLVRQSDISLLQIQKLTDYQGDSSVKLKAEKLFGFYNQIFHDEYRKMVEIFLKGDNASPADVAELNKIVKDVRVREKALNQALTEAQVKFSKKFGFEFSENAVEDAGPE